MTPSCADLEAYLDETIEGAARARFEEHLLGCASCQAEVEEAMQLFAAGAELSRRPDRPLAAPLEELARAASLEAQARPASLEARDRPALLEARDRPTPLEARDRPTPIDRARAARRRRLGWIGAAVAAVAAAAVWVLWMRPGPDPGLAGHGPAVEDRIVAVLAPRRSLELRLPYAPLDGYRPYDVGRGASDPEPITNRLIADVEAERPAAALAAVLLARRDFVQAEAILARAGKGDELELARAALAIARNEAPQAIAHLDGVLDRSPASGVALWNRALVLAALRLPLAAAEGFEVVARLGEQGWSAEAAERAARLRDPELARAARWKAAKEACKAMSPEQLPDRAVVRMNASLCRPDFYGQVRAARSRDALLALAPVAEELDEAARNTAATSLLRRVAGADWPRRQRAAEVYLQLIQHPELPEDGKRRLLDQLRASGQDDLVLGAIRRSGLSGLREEYVRRAQASGDPYFVEIAEEHGAAALVAGGRLLDAEVVLRRAVDACSGRDVELRCSYLQLALTDVYVAMHRPSEARAVAQAGIERSRRLGLYWDERLFLDYLAKAMRLGSDDALMRAHVREATLRSRDECAQVQFNQELLAEASLDALRFARARRDLAEAPTCDLPPSETRARVVAELARIDGTPAEARALAAGLVQARRQPDLTAGRLAYLDAIEGRLLAARDPDAARPLLRRAIEAADRAGRGDAEAALARRDAYGSLLVISGAAGASGAAGVSGAGAGAAASLALFAEATGTPPRDGACAVGAMVDGERVLVVARDAGGALAQHFDPHGRTGPALEPAALIPAPMVRSLAGCKRVDVLALPPLFGLADLLPPDLAWSYRGRPTGAAGPPPARPTIVTVTDVTPPPELKLPPLGLRRLAPISGAVHVELTGAAATPARVTSSLASADAIEIHAHGFVDQGRSDASVIALSPGADGQFALRAREIADLRLTRSPLVLLGACHAAYTAPYRHEPWGLPRAFLLAGARAVVASPEVISDAEAGELFRAVEARILAGVDPAVALRDERARRLAANPTSWARAILLFD